jgi:hypothetical protein
MDTKPKQEALTLAMLLGDNCSSPESYKEHVAHERVVRDWMNSPEHETTPYPSYRGWNVFEISLHCIRYTIVARLLEDNTYEIREYTTEDI